MRTALQLSDIKAGDEVAVMYGSTVSQVCRVSKATARYIETPWGKLGTQCWLRSSGQMRGAGRWDQWHIEPATDEHKRVVARACKLARLRACNWAVLSDADMDAVLAIVTRTKP